MIKYQLKYGIQLSLDATSAEEYKAIAFTLQYPKAQDHFVPNLQREIESLTGYYGHTISIDSITIPDFVKAMIDLGDRWGSTLIEGADLAGLPISRIPPEVIS